MGLLVSIDNGGTLTDVCATDGQTTVHAKTLTTPHDLTECFIKSLEVLSERLYGEADIMQLVSEVDYIRYSTTQGTNAIVQRKGPRIGLITDSKALVDEARSAMPELFEAFVGDRISIVPVKDADASRQDLIKAVTDLVSNGAMRLVISLSGEDIDTREHAVRRVLYKAFPRHLLGAVPMLFSSQLIQFGEDKRRLWGAVINAFLHPAMEQFLYNAENSLRDARAKRPLLIFRNDGTSTRVAKTMAIKTYSSGPQGGVVGGEALTRHYGINSAVSIDIGGTTTDIAVFKDAQVDKDSLGTIEGAPLPFAMSQIQSIGAGGGSIIRAKDGKVTVGPDSVGAAPGPACFGRGGTEATITDVFLTEGVLDPDSYFGGRLKLDRERAQKAIMTNVAEPLRLDLNGAVDAMMRAYHGKIGQVLVSDHGVTSDQTLMAFGGAGPMSACAVAEEAGLSTVLIPRFAAVFSAFGITFSDIQHLHTARMTGDAREELTELARRGMFAEGFDIKDCDMTFEDVATDNGAFLNLTVTRPIAKPVLTETGCTEKSKATASGVREGRSSLPIYRLEDLSPGDWAEGPCLVEEAFFTAHVKDRWRFVISDNGDVFLRR